MASPNWRMGMAFSPSSLRRFAFVMPAATTATIIVCMLLPKKPNAC